MKHVNYKKFRYKGQTYHVIERGFSVDLPGARIPKNGVNIIIINKNLKPHKKNLELHRLITGRGVHLFKHGKRVGKFA